MPARGDRLIPVSRVQTRLQKRLMDAIGSASVQAKADEWTIPYWVIRDTLRGSTDCPRGMYILPMARGMGISAETLIEDAYTPLEAVPA